MASSFAASRTLASSLTAADDRVSLSCVSANTGRPASRIENRIDALMATSSGVEATFYHGVAKIARIARVPKLKFWHFRRFWRFWQSPLANKKRIFLVGRPAVPRRQLAEPAKRGQGRLYRRDDGEHFPGRGHDRILNDPGGVIHPGGQLGEELV